MRYSVIGASVEQVRSIGGKNIREAPSTGIIFATLTEEQAEKLRAIGFAVSEVGSVKTAVMPPTPIAAVPTYSPQDLSFAAGYEQLRSVMVPPLYGSGFNLAIIDSGLRETHEFIKGRVVYSKNYTSAPMGDQFSHGTAVAGVAVAIAPQCNVLNLKVLDDKGAGTEEEVVLAVDDCINLIESRSEIAPHVINLSLGSPDDGNPNNPVRVVCRAAIERGIWVFAAAGNVGPSPSTIMSPACERYVCAVGSASYDPFIVNDWSSRGPTREGLIKPDGLLFGENLIVASSASDTATEAKSGTSFTVPFVSGMAIITREGQYRQAVLTSPIPGMTWEQGYAMTEQTLLDTYAPLICIKPQSVAKGKDNDYGWGLPFGPYIQQVIQPVPEININTILGMTVMMGMLGIIIKVAR